MASFTVRLLVPALLATGCAAGDAASTARDRLNVLLIVCDTLRADALGLYNGDPAASPEIDALGRTGLVAERTYAQAPWTPPSMSSLFTSTYQSVHGVINAPSDREKFTPLPESFATLPEILRDHGYRTAAVSAQPWVSPRTGFGQGFDEFAIVSDIKDVYSTDKVAQAAIARIDAWQREAAAPFFLFVNFLNPYEPPPPFDTLFWDGPPPPRLADLRGRSWQEQARFLLKLEGGEIPPASDAELRYLRALYRAEVRYVDWWIGVLRRHLDALDLTRSTLVVFTSDHGESFLEHGRMRHTTHVYNENLHVPLLFSNPARFPEAQRHAAVSESIDVLPTLLGLLGLPVPAQAQGRDLRQPDGAERLAFAEGLGLTPVKVQSAEWSFIVGPAADGAPRRELYALGDDPAEARPLPDPSAHVVRSFEAAMRARAEANRAHPLRQRATPQAMDPQMAEQLRALGYLE